jgi:integrase
MAKIISPLTNTEVKQAKARDKEYTLADGDGLQLRVRPNGSKLWILKYSQPFTKKRNNLGLGKYPEVTLAQARDKRKEIKGLIAQDIDPKTHKEEQEQQKKEAIENTFGMHAVKWFELKKSQVKLETAEHAWKNLERHVLPIFENIPVHLIKPKLVLDTLKPLAAKGSYETIKRLCRNINEVMRLAVAAGVIEVNYLADVTRLFPAPKKQNMATIEPSRLPELMKAIVFSNITKPIKCLVEWQLHTMTRPIEAATARWQDIDLDNKVWVIPAERMKMKKPHTIPLTSQTLSLLELIKAMSGNSEYLFPSRNNIKSHANSQSVNMALKRVGFEGELVSHGLRALASTTLNEQGFDSDIIESALAHVDKNEVRRAYNRSEYLERRRVLMAWWSNHIETCASGNYSLANSMQGLRIVNA